MLKMLPTIALFLASVTAVYTLPETNSDIDILANDIAYRLTNSNFLNLNKVIPFEVPDPWGVYYRVSIRLLERAGINKPELARLDADAAQEAKEIVGKFTSELYIRTVGYELAKYFDHYGFVRDGSSIFLAFMVVTAVELEASINGVYDAESFSNAVVFGIHDIMRGLGLSSYENMEKLFYVFAEELLIQAKKS